MTRRRSLTLFRSAPTLPRPARALYEPHGQRPIGTVLEVSSNHEFDDGTERPAVRMKTATGAAMWVPREGLDKALLGR